MTSGRTSGLDGRRQVIVVGAGLAGLTAASRLVEHDIDVTVLEARDRVGGRTHGLEVAPGSWVDAGAAYLGERHTELRTLLTELGLDLMPTAMEGASRFALAGSNQTAQGRFPPLSAVALGEMFDLLDELTKLVDVDQPWLTADAGSLDNLTVAAWVDKNLTHPDTQVFFPLFIGEMMAADPADISVLHMAFYLASGGGLSYLNAFEGGAQESRVVGGAHQICERLAQRLGDRVRLLEPVRLISHEEDSVTVRTELTERHEFRADALVVAVPALVADAIQFDPMLPVSRTSMQTGRGCAVKVHLVYERPQWRDDGLSGWSVSSGGPLLSTVDDSPADAQVGVLTGFVTGQEARTYGALSATEQRDLAVAQAGRLFPTLPAPTGFWVTDWVSEEFSRGCYASLFGPGDWMSRGPHLITPHGRVHWAGTATSTEFFGLMEGAVRSGRRAADEIIDTYATTRSIR